MNRTCHFQALWTFLSVSWELRACCPTEETRVFFYDDKDTKNQNYISDGDQKCVIKFYRYAYKLREQQCKETLTICNYFAWLEKEFHLTVEKIVIAKDDCYNYCDGWYLSGIRTVRRLQFLTKKKVTALKQPKVERCHDGGANAFFSHWPSLLSFWFEGTWIYKWVEELSNDCLTRCI